ncbi:unnamed protein product [Calypogeia fissa]
MIFSLNTKRQAVTWKRGKFAPNATPVPEELQGFFLELTETVHDIAANRIKALEQKRKKEEEEREKAKVYYEENKERIDAERELKRRKMEEEAIERQKKDAEQTLKEKLSSRKNELARASRVMKWKASAAEPASAPEEKTTPTASDQMRESAKRGPEHDLCEKCGETLKFCAHQGCTIIGCVKCFEEELTMCACSSYVFADHHNDFDYCSGCESLVCKACGGNNCDLCNDFVCHDCNECQGCGVRLDEPDFFEYEDHDCYDCL